MNNTVNMWDFPVMDGVHFPNANRIHPLMQRRVQKLWDAAWNDENIRLFAVFGSSLEFRCGSESDLDLYLEKFDTSRKLDLWPDVGCRLDILMDLDHESKLYKEIDNKGLLLFERG